MKSTSKIELTRKELNCIEKRVICVGYCGAQYLLHDISPFAYNHGVYGWNWDAYDIGGGVAVCTGYRNLTGICVDYADLEERAREVIENNYFADYEECKKRLGELRAELVKRALAA